MGEILKYFVSPILKSLHLKGTYKERGKMYGRIKKKKKKRHASKGQSI